ncbi:MvaI/BcnI restriction endonuclease family protein [Permianibacter aggregans]|nr:MvaI/BcnI restriction endonuclease family protein [Permianibacter aggregans]
MTLQKLLRLFRDCGVNRLYVKLLSPNDNSKNQPYFGGDFSSLNIFPTGPISVVESASKKSLGEKRFIYKAPLSFRWIGPDGTIYPSPNAKLILYPQYPEVRFSGFLSNSSVDASQWMDPSRKGRVEGRILLMGVTEDGITLGYLIIPGAGVGDEVREAISAHSATGVFHELPLADDASDNKRLLLNRLREIHLSGWIPSQRLDSRGNILACNSFNCGGYTLEAKFGITPNGFSEPDYLGWELKQYSVKSFARVNSQVVTLMTPEPNEGFYKERGVADFIRMFGYKDVSGKADRLNFGGIHRFSAPASRTGLALNVHGFDHQSGKITDPNGGIVLETVHGEVAAKWAFPRLLDHWKRKHERAVYVPSIMRLEPNRSYHFGNKIKVGEQTDFCFLLSALCKGLVYYDPGIKMEGASTTKPEIKRRSQFRIRSESLGALYKHFMDVDLLDVPKG